MSDFFMQVGLSNAFFSLVLAGVAVAVGAKGKRAGLAHLLWLLVFVKLLTPPVLTVGVFTLPQTEESVVSFAGDSGQGIYQGDMISVDASGEIEGAAGGSVIGRAGSVVLGYGRVWVPMIWLAGSLIFLGWSLVRVYRFSRLLGVECEVGEAELQGEAAKIAGRLGLKKLPTIYTTAARLTPMVWWAGGKVKVIVGASLLEQMSDGQRELVLAHELAHVRRRDHLVRWIEWLGCVCFWWNPVVWWAQRNLRAMEEICCDELVVSSLRPEPKYYANTLLSIVEFIAGPAIRPPAMASEINSGGFLERRFRMIISRTQKKTNSRRFQLMVLLLAVIVLPFGFAYGADKNDRIEGYLDMVWEKLEAEVDAGNMSYDEAKAKMLAIEKEAYSKDKREDRGKKDVDIEALGRKIRAAVQSGEITAEEGRAKMAGIRARMGQDEKGGGLRLRYAAAVEKIKAAVEAGEITEEEAEEKILALRRRIAAAGEKERDVDWDAIKKRIEGAVERGDMTREEADAKYREIKQRMAEGKDEGLRERYAAAVEEIKAAVEAGTITEEQAKERYEALRRRFAASREKESDVDWRGIIARLKAAVEAGEMTEEEAKDKIAGIKKRIAASREKDVDIEAIARKIRAAVESGEITAEEGRRKMAAIRAKMGEGEKGAGLRERYEAAVERIKAAVEAGTITEEEAEEKIIALRKRIAVAEERMEEDNRGGSLRQRYAIAAERIEAAVEAGDITEEQAEEKLIALRKRIAAAQGQKKTDFDWESVKTRIEGAVERGDMTREEANAKYREIRSRLAGGDRGWGKRESKESDIDFEAVVRRIRAAVEAGDMTREEAAKKLAEIRKRMGHGERGGEKRGGREHDGEGQGGGRRERGGEGSGEHGGEGGGRR